MAKLATTRRSLLKYSAASSALALAGPLAGRAWAQSVASPIRLGVLYD